MGCRGDGARKSGWGKGGFAGRFSDQHGNRVFVLSAGDACVERLGARLFHLLGGRGKVGLGDRSRLVLVFGNFMRPLASCKRRVERFLQLVLRTKIEIGRCEAGLRGELAEARSAPLA